MFNLSGGRFASLIRQPVASANALPTRAFVKAKKRVEKAPKEITVRLVPYIPPDQIRETMKFLQTKNTQSSLVDLIFNPVPEKITVTDKSRLEYQTKLEEYEFKKEEFLRDFRVHEERARKSMYDAIQELPEDLFDEAAASTWTEPPEDILHSYRYRKQFYLGDLKKGVQPEFSDNELKKLQIFQNLMHIRFPHSAMKKQKPEKFWIPDTQAVSRQKEAAGRARIVKKKK